MHYWLDLKAAIEYSGLSRSTLKRAVYAGKLKCARGVVGKMMFRREWLDLFILGHSGRLSAVERTRLRRDGLI